MFVNVDMPPCYYHLIAVAFSWNEVMTIASDQIHKHL